MGGQGFISSCFLTLLSSLILFGPSGGGPDGQEVIHPITVFHPGMKQAKDCQLVERKDETGHAIDFYMDVASVICLDGLCKVVDVRLVWDKFGQYHSYELAEGTALEKKDGEAFTSADYDKLHQILKDKHSVFRAFELGQIVNMGTDSTGIDGITGATVLTDEAASVKGAAWTCYTLWHWANGEVKHAIFDITGRSLSHSELLNLLSEDTLSVRLALSQLEKRNLYDETTIDALCHAVAEWETVSVKQSVSYLERAPVDVYFSTVRRIWPNVGSRQRVLLLKSIMENPHPAPNAAMREFAYFIPQLSSFQEVNLLLNFLADGQVENDAINEQLIPLLAAENFITARRVYWFLQNQRLSAEGEQRLSAFGEKHADRL